MVANLIVQTVVWFGTMGLLLFFAAGTLDWPAAWIFLAVMVAFSLVGGLALGRRDPELLRERLSPPVQKDQPAADKVLLVIILLVIFGSLALMGLDAVRFGWSAVPPWVQGAGALILLLGIWLCYRTMRENSFAAPVVKIQRERGQTGISAGPHAHVRHPMYSGALLYFVGTSLLLGSWWGMVAVLVLAVQLAIRIAIEEKTLRAGLQGYDDYAARVRYRLVPLIW